MTHKGFPGLGIVDGDLFCTYRNGATHAGAGANRGKIYYKTSADSGVTWGTATLIFDDTVNTEDARDPTVLVTAADTVLVFYFISDAVTDSSIESWVARSTDDGGTWTHIAITYSFTDWGAASGMPVQLPSGRILLPLYGADSGGSTNWSARVSYSDDDGVTWAHLSNIVDGVAAGRQYSEPSIVFLSNGDLGCMIRTDDDLFYWSTSTDDGATWSTPTTTGIAGSGRPGILRTSENVILFIYRAVNSDAIIRQSLDDGVTWSPATWFNVIDTRYVYCQMVEMSPGVVGVAHAWEDNFGNNGTTEFDSLVSGIFTVTASALGAWGGWTGTASAFVPAPVEPEPEIIVVIGDPSPQFEAAVEESHQLFVGIDVMFNRVIVYENLAVVDGAITFDRNAQSLARCDITFAEPLLVPTGADDLLSPFGYELFIKRGVVRTPLLTEVIPLGVFPIQTSTVDGVSLITDISGMDRSQLVRDARFEDDYEIVAGTNYATAIQVLIADGVNGLVYAFATTFHTTPLLVFEAQSDRWDAAQKMAASIGCELFFDGLGRCVLRQELDLSTAVPRWTIAEGDDGILVAATLDLDRSSVYNKWIHSSNNSAGGAVFTGSAVDDDPGSPTYYDGPFGRKPKFFASEFYASDAQCAAGAAADKARSIGAARGFQFGSLPNPAMRPGDVVLVQRVALNVDEVHVVDSFTLPLGPESVTVGRSRARQEIT